MARFRSIVKWSTVGLALLNVLLLVWLHFGMADRFLGLGPVESIAERFDHSYSAADNPYFITQADPSFKPLLRLITRYTHASVDATKVKYIARFQAIASVRGPMLANGTVPEWTAPETPIAAVNVAPGITTRDYVVVGSIADLHSWIQRARDDFHFVVVDVMFGLLSTIVAVLLVVTKTEALSS